MEFQNWKQDPRLRSMDPDKIKQMEQLAARQASAASHESPGQQRFPAILNLRNGHSFFDPDRPNAPSAETAGGNAADAEPADGRGK